MPVRAAADRGAGGGRGADAGNGDGGLMPTAMTANGRRQPHNSRAFNRVPGTMPGALHR